MLLTVEHVTRYSYDAPVRGVVQSHRLTPTLCEGQKTLSWNVQVSDGLMGGGFRDGAGDWVQSWSVLGPLSEILVTVTGVVETTDLAGLLRGNKETVPPAAYLRDTFATRCDVRLKELGAGLAGAADVLGSAHELSDRVAQAIEYVTDVTKPQTTAAEAMALGKGVCQDQAQVMVAVARHVGIPARYVSGYLQAGEKASSKDAAHAWAELFIQNLGWVGFDPANSCCPDARYIRLGSGLDAQDAAPIRGVSRGNGQEILDVSVSVQVQQ
jgi:transglutaminase-like putative cysteine protease